jgi:hypothetical protein
VHTFKELNNDELDYIHSGSVTFKVYGMIDQKKNGLLTDVKDMDTPVKKSKFE